MLIIMLRRIYQAILVLLLVALISFCIFRFVGDPVDNILGQEATVEDRNEMIDRMGLDDPVIVQYGRFICCLLYTSPSPRDATLSRMPSSA